MKSHLLAVLLFEPLRVGEFLDAGLDDVGVADHLPPQLNSYRPDLGLRIVPYYGGEKLGTDNTFSSRAINKIINIVVNR